jgi:hypothetical protein
MKNAIRSSLRNTALVLSVIVLTTQLAEAARLPRVEAAQADAAAQAAAQATASAQMAAQQAAQQANDQALQAAQQANQQAMQAAQQANDDTSAPPAPIRYPAPTALSPSAPVPAQIPEAHTVFLANAGADANFPVDETQAYNNVLASLQSWGHYQFVDAPAKADLVFQLHDIAPITQVAGNRGGVYSLASPAFQLTVSDPKTNVALWTITSPVYAAGNKAARARWFALSVSNLTSRVKVLAGQSLTPVETANLTQAPKDHRLMMFLILAGILSGAAIGTGIILKDKYDKNVANQNAAACASNPVFCHP